MRAQAVRRRIGLSGQEPAVDEILSLSGRQNLVLFGRLNRLSRGAAERRADELLARLGLTDAAGKAVKHYSGGMRRRLDLAVDADPGARVLFLDEPTTGLDPRNRNEVWSAIRELVAGGTNGCSSPPSTSTRPIQLADKVVVIDTGRKIAEGAAELKAQIGGDRLDVVVPEGEDLATVVDIVGRADGGRGRRARTSRAGSASRSPTASPRSPRWCGPWSDAGVVVDDIGLRRPTLDDVFLELTGRRTRSDGTGADPAGRRPRHRRWRHRARRPLDRPRSRRRTRHRGRRYRSPAWRGPCGDGWLVAGRDVAQWVREPQLIVWGLIYPVVSVLLFAYVFGSGIIVPGGGSYREFLMPGIFAQTMAFGIGETLAAVQADSAKGVTDRFRSMPMAPSAVVVGRCVSGMLYSGRQPPARWRRAGWPSAGAGTARRSRRLAPSGCCSCCAWRSCGSASSSGCGPKSPEMANSIFGLSTR